MDIENVIKSLKWFRDRDSWREGIMIHDDHAEVRKRICDNALLLLKEQEAVEPVPPEDEFGLYRCGKCHHQLFRCVDKYCSRCGQAVKWE